MSRSAVHDILQQIDALPAKQRQRLEQELAARADAEWARLAKDARGEARRRKIGQVQIDRAVEQLRYGRR